MLCPGVVYPVVAVLAGFAVTALAVTEDSFELDPVLVTDRYAGRAADLAGSVSVLTREEIDRAGARGLVEVLARVPGVSPRALFSNGKFSGVDLRGQGDGNASNVLILVDGVRLNFDQAGADLTSLALDNIERIEVYRGAQGVRFGGGAVGGVINIITRRPEEPSFNTGLRIGSHGHRRLQVRAELRGGTLAAVAGASRERDLGYRSNSDFQGQDESLRLDWDAPWGLHLFGGATWHDDEFGLPGPISALAYATEAGRRSASSSTDRGASDERRWQMGLDWQRPHASVRADYSRRERRAHFFQTDSRAAGNLLTASLEQANALAQVEHTWLGVAVRLDLGGEWRQAEGENFRGGRDQPDTVRTRIEQSTRAGFGALRLSPRDWLHLDLGFRSERSEVDFQRDQFVQRCSPGPTLSGPDQLVTVVETQSRLVTRTELIPVSFMGVTILVPTPITFVVTEDVARQILMPGAPLPTPEVCGPHRYVADSIRKAVWDQNARELALLLRPSSATDLYLRHVSSFRLPNVDDLNLASDVLGPQSGNEDELGLRWRPGLDWLIDGSIFRSRTQNEIYFGLEPGQAVRVNRNFQSPVQRRGADLSLQMPLTVSTTLRVNVSHVDARFSEGGGRVPLVPQVSGSVGLDWSWSRGTEFSLTSLFSASRLDGDELDGNRFASVPGWHVENLQWSVIRNGFDLRAGINNVFDVRWADSVYSANYFPLAGREWYAEVRLRLP